MEYYMEFHGTLVPPNEISLSSMEYSMEFHGTLVPPNEVSLSSMEFHGSLRLSFYDMLPWTSKGYSVEFHGTLESPNKKSPSSMGFHGIRRAPFQMTQVFHGIPWNIPWNCMELWCRQMKYHLVPWNSMELWCRQMKYHLVSWNSMEYSMELHGTLVPPNEVSLSSMEFHRTLRLSFYFMLPWTSKGYSIPGNSMELWSRQIKNHRIPWDSMELGGRHFKWHKCSMEFHAIFQRIPWKYGSAKWSIT